MMRQKLLTALAVTSLLNVFTNAQGTKLWSVDHYEQMEKGSSNGVAIRSDGQLEPGPATQLIYDTGKSYIWSLATDGAENKYLGLGGSTADSALVIKITPQGNATKLFEGKELAVQALHAEPNGVVLAATSPDGKVYKISPGNGSPAVLFDAAATQEKPKYIWDLAVDKSGEIYIATGAPAVVYKVSANGGKPEVLYKTTDQHIRCLMLTPDGTLWAGSDGSGVIYRIDTQKAGAKPFAVYGAPKHEITALAQDDTGNIYAAGVGAKGPSNLPPLPVTGNVGVTVTFLQPGSSSAANANTLIPDGSELYKISPDGTPERLVSLKEDVVYALKVHDGKLFAATGNRGRVYRIDTGIAGRFTDIAHIEASQIMAFAPEKDGLLVATSNSGKLFRLADRTAGDSTYTSEVFDAQAFSQWGRAEIRAGTASNYDLYVRSGNVENPLMGWSEWSRVGTDGAIQVQPGRYAQWKAVLRTGSTVDSVGLNYLMKNIAPVVDEIAVQPGARVPTPGGVPPNTTVQVAFSPSTSNSAINFQQDPNTAPLTAQKDKNAITARWLAHDDNGDDLTFAVWYRGIAEKNWRLLNDQISDRFFSFDTSLLPDGSYELKVVASDAPAHTESEALVGSKISDVFVIDTTPPVPGPLQAAIVREATAGVQKIHATLEAKDALSPLSHAEYSVDAGPWQYLEPVGKISDSQTEHYDFTANIPTPTTPVADSKEHVLAVRIYDRYENMAAVKVVVR